jgi:hypothetical protein
MTARVDLVLAPLSQPTTAVRTILYVSNCYRGQRLAGVVRPEPAIHYCLALGRSAARGVEHSLYKISLGVAILGHRLAVESAL